MEWTYFEETDDWRTRLGTTEAQWAAKELEQLLLSKLRTYMAGYVSHEVEVGSVKDDLGGCEVRHLWTFDSSSYGEPYSVREVVEFKRRETVL